MAYPARKKSDEGIESPIAKTDEALNEGVRRERLSRADRVSIWWISVMMVMVFLILVLFMIQVLFSSRKADIQLKAPGTATLCPSSLFSVGTGLNPFFHRPATLKPSKSVQSSDIV